MMDIKQYFSLLNELHNGKPVVFLPEGALACPLLLEVEGEFKFLENTRFDILYPEDWYFDDILRVIKPIIPEVCEPVLELEKRFIPFPQKTSLLNKTDKLIFYAIPNPFKDFWTDLFIWFNNKSCLRCGKQHDIYDMPVSMKEAFTENYYFTWILNDRGKLLGRCFLAKDFSYMFNLYPKDFRTAWRYHEYDYAPIDSFYLNDIIYLSYPSHTDPSYFFNKMMNTLDIQVRQCKDCHAIGHIDNMVSVKSFVWHCDDCY